MAFGDWDFFLTNTATASIEVTDPIIGSGSLAIGKQSTPGVNLSGAGHLDTGFTVGLEKGRIRTLTRMNWDTAPTAVFDNAGHWIYFMADASDITTGTPDFYLAGLSKLKNTANDFRPVIAKQVGGTLLNAFVSPDVGPGADLIANTASDITILEGEQIAMQVEWNLDIAGLGGCRITVSVGNVDDVDFSNLSTVYDIVDSSPLTNAIGEGIAFQYNTTHTFLATEYAAFDSTGVFQLV